MGSDDGLKRSRAFKRRLSVCSCCQAGNNTTKGTTVSVLVAAFLSLGILVLLVVVVVHFLAEPEVRRTHTFVRDYDALPAQCVDVARSFDDCQTTTTAAAAAAVTTQQQKQQRSTIVLACHRKWCNALWGHCEPCSGIGDRTRFVVSQIQEISCHVGVLKIDNPSEGMAIVESALYKDGSGWWGEWLHYRSYDVSKRDLLPYSELARMEQVTNSKNSTTSYLQQQSQSLLMFSHFTPEHYVLNEAYDACYFHTVFQPTPELQADVDHHTKALLSNHNDIKYSIGIHFRTGDAVSFGVHNHDNRLASTASDGWQHMKQCAVQLAQRLYPKIPLTDIAFFLATDNAKVKAQVRQDKYLDEQRAGLQVYLTDDDPDSFLRGNQGDYQAWLELLLLSQRQGLVVNVLPYRYRGSAKRISQFALLAKKIGFLQDFQVMECKLDPN